ncbi:MAG: hypothetical protein VXZ78_07060 [Pseudomonadota bacterium]|nr:hypothetical protein [Pseudomonadota bacterium]
MVFLVIAGAVVEEAVVLAKDALQAGAWDEARAEHRDPQGGGVLAPMLLMVMVMMVVVLMALVMLPPREGAVS